jgi:cyclopropane-fatty-acyl-phospholipid synthase
MSVQQVLKSDPVVGASRAFLDELLSRYGARDFAVRFWDGTTWEPDTAQLALFTLVLQHPGSVRKMFWPPNKVAFGEAYIYNDFDIEGDIIACMRLVNYFKSMHWSWRKRWRLARQLFRLPVVNRPRLGRQAAKMSGPVHSIERDRQAISYHYDVGNDFYQLWLDRRMMYTCAYFAEPDDDLHAAQEHKLDYICRKLRLKPGERLLDIGCGWGGLVLFAAQHYGVEAVGITLSRPQVEYARETIRQAGLAGRCRVEYLDYREIDEPEGFDKLACIGLLEHAGESMMPTFFRCAWRLLKPGGVFLNHGITLHVHVPMPKGRFFAHQYVFPDGELRPVHITLRHAEAAGFEVRDVESLREHYIRTLRSWIGGLEDHADEARQVTDDVTYRTWRLYMAGAADGYQTGKFNLHQELLAKPKNGVTGLPMTRADWFR